VLDVDVASFDLQGTHPVDVADERGLAEAVTEVRQLLGPIDFSVNCAGVGAGVTRLGRLRRAVDSLLPPPITWSDWPTKVPLDDF
jgi:NAD(P)-dependent dehydrogenase (short-subunit alcohol dehydrogenase family)